MLVRQMMNFFPNHSFLGFIWKEYAETLSGYQGSDINKHGENCPLTIKRIN